MYYSTLSDEEILGTYWQSLLDNSIWVCLEVSAGCLSKQIILFCLCGGSSTTEAVEL